MKGALTYQDLERLRAKARGFDAALDYLAGRVSTEEGAAVEAILRAAIAYDCPAATPVNGGEV